MGMLLDDLIIKDGHNKNDSKQDQCRRTGAALTVSFQRIINKAHHCVQPLGCANRTHILAEDTDNAGIFLETADKAGDDNLGQHGRKKRNGDAGEDTATGCAVYLGSIVILLIDALQTAQENQDLEGQCIPYDVNHHNRHIRPIL